MRELCSREGLFCEICGFMSEVPFKRTARICNCSDGHYSGQGAVKLLFLHFRREETDIANVDTKKRIWDRYAPVYEKAMRIDRKIYAFMYRRIPEVVRNKDVLEIAAGPGTLAKYIAEDTRHIIATDYSEGMIREAKKGVYSSRLTFEVADAMDLPYPHDSFDVVIIANALHVMPEPEQVLKEIRRVLRPGGILIAPNFVNHGKTTGSRIWSDILKIAGVSFRHQWTPKGYLSFLRKNGWKVIHYKILKARIPELYTECVYKGPKTGSREIISRQKAEPDRSESDAPEEQVKTELLKDRTFRENTGILGSFDNFCEAAEEEVQLLPEYVWKELNGGVICDISSYLHPGRLADDLYILGTYSDSGLFGKQITLYYGSFVAVLGNSSDERVRSQLRETIRHEFRHHLETRAGLFGKGTLIEEDEIQMMKYYEGKAQKNDPSGAE